AAPIRCCSANCFRPAMASSPASKTRAYVRCPWCSWICLDLIGRGSPHSCRVGETHQIPGCYVGGFHPPYKLEPRQGIVRRLTVPGPSGLEQVADLSRADLGLSLHAVAAAGELLGDRLDPGFVQGDGVQDCGLVRIVLAGVDLDPLDLLQLGFFLG